MKLSLSVVLLIYFVKIASSSDDKGKIPQMEDDLSLISSKVDEFKNLLDLCAELESKEKEKTKLDESMETSISEQSSTPASSPSKSPENVIDPTQSPRKPRLVFYTYDGVTYKINPQITVRVKPALNEKDKQLAERRKRRLTTTTAFKKRTSDDCIDCGIPSKSRDLRASPSRERRHRVFEYDKNDDEEEKNRQMEELTSGLLKATLEEKNENVEKDENEKDDNEENDDEDSEEDEEEEEEEYDEQEVEGYPSYSPYSRES